MMPGNPVPTLIIGQARLTLRPLEHSSTRCSAFATHASSFSDMPGSAFEK